LLVWDKESYTERDSCHSFHAHVYYNCIGSSLPELFTTSQSPSHSDLCQFQSTILAPLQQAHQPLSSLCFLHFPIPPVCVLPLVCDPCPIVLLHLF
jgi:hypothetical protein